MSRAFWEYILLFYVGTVADTSVASKFARARLECWQRLSPADKDLADSLTIPLPGGTTKLAPYLAELMLKYPIKEEPKP